MKNTDLQQLLRDWTHQDHEDNTLRDQVVRYLGDEIARNMWQEYQYLKKAGDRIKAYEYVTQIANTLEKHVKAPPNSLAARVEQWCHSPPYLQPELEERINCEYFSASENDRPMDDPIREWISTCLEIYSNQTEMQERLEELLARCLEAGLDSASSNNLARDALNLYTGATPPPYSFPSDDEIRRNIRNFLDLS